MPSCPSVDELKQLLAEELAADEYRAIEAHLHACATCVETLTQLADDPQGAEWRRLLQANVQEAGAECDAEDQTPMAPAPMAPAPMAAELASNASMAEPVSEQEAPSTKIDTAPWTERAAGELPCVPGYEILGRLGGGGMGIVYRARQHHPQRLVALKMILDFHGRAEEIERFRAEADAVAQLQHPNIVQVFELNEWNGKPYFSMELVEGGSLANKIRGTPQPPREAAALLECLAATMHAVHQRGVIHRDLKPANVLLTAGGAPKVADFGLVKRLEVPGQTRTGMVMGTPEYMAPEQASGQSKEAGPTTDVYALGAILYELLTARPPFKGATTFDTLAQVVHQNPVPPRQLNPQVPRDLETICLKCLQKEPRKRYESALALTEDLRRFQAGEPIRARPVGRLERLVKWVRRNKTAAALLAALAVLVLGGSAAALWFQADQMRQTTEMTLRQKYLNKEVALALDEAANKRAELRGKLHDRKLVQPLLSDIDLWRRLVEEARLAWRRAQALAEADPELLNDDLASRLHEIAQGLATDEADWVLAEELDRVNLQVWSEADGRFDSQGIAKRYPQVFAKAGLSVERGDLTQVSELIRLSPARYALVAALDRWADVTALWMPRASVPAVRWLQAAVEPWAPTPERALLARLLEVARKVDPDPWRDRFRNLKVWDDPQQLERLAEELPNEQPPQVVIALAVRLKGTTSLAILRRALLHHPQDFWLYFTLGNASKDPVERIGCFQAAAAIRPRSASAYNNLGVALRDHGDLAGALGHYYKSIQLDPRDAMAHYNLGVALYDQKDVAAAMVHYRTAIELNPSYVTAHYNLGLALYGQGKLDEAAAHYRKAIEADPKYAPAHCNLGLVLYGQKDLEGAIIQYRKSLRIEPKDAVAHNGLGNALRDKKDFKGAIAEFREAIKLDPGDIMAHHNLGLALQDTNDLQGAMAQFRTAIRLNAKHAPSYVGTGAVLRATKDLDGAIAEYRKALEIDADLVLAHNRLGVALAEKKDFNGALAHFKNAIRLDPKYAPAHYNLGNVLRDTKDLDGAIEQYRKTIELDAKDASAHNNLGNVLYTKKDLEGAAAEHRNALEIDPQLVTARGALGRDLLELGRFTEARQQTLHCLKLLSPNHPLRTLVTNQLKRCDELLLLDEKLAIFLEHGGPPTETAEQLALADLCRRHKRYHSAAVRLYVIAFAGQPTVADELAKGYRYQAACSAVLAAGGKGLDPPSASSQEPAKLRAQALHWLQADLHVARQANIPKAAADVRVLLGRLEGWQKDSELTSVREARALAALPPQEERAWQSFWADVDRFVKHLRDK